MGGGGGGGRAGGEGDSLWRRDLSALGPFGAEANFGVQDLRNPKTASQQGFPPPLGVSQKNTFPSCLLRQALFRLHPTARSASLCFALPISWACPYLGASAEDRPLHHGLQRQRTSEFALSPWPQSFETLYIHACKCLCMYISIYMNMYRMQVHACTDTSRCMSTHTHTFTCVCVRACVCVCVDFMHMYVHVYM